MSFYEKKKKEEEVLWLYVKSSKKNSQISNLSQSLYPLIQFSLFIV